MMLYKDKDDKRSPEHSGQVLLIIVEKLAE